MEKSEKMNNEVLIMMTSYNGEDYIDKQIESIVNQTYTNWKLLIQDDGSLDNTCSIIEQYTNIDDRIIFYKNEESIHGAFVNFHILVNKVKDDNTLKSDYYMFCDQDDLWDTDKIEKMINHIKSIEHDQIPVLLYADMRTISSDDKVLESSIDKAWKISGKNAYSYFFSHKVFGCNLIMNDSLFRLAPKLDVYEEYISNISHDNYFAKFAAVYGKISFLNLQTMGYRRHGNNQTSEQEYRVKISRIIKRIFSIKDLARRHSIPYQHSMYIINLIRKLDRSGDTTYRLSHQQRRFLDTVEITITKGGFVSLKNILGHNIKWGGLVENISHTIILFLKYQKYTITQ